MKFFYSVRLCFLVNNRIGILRPLERALEANKSIHSLPIWYSALLQVATKFWRFSTFLTISLCVKQQQL